MVRFDIQRYVYRAATDVDCLHLMLRVFCIQLRAMLADSKGFPPHDSQDAYFWHEIPGAWVSCSAPDYR